MANAQEQESSLERDKTDILKTVQTFLQCIKAYAPEQMHSLVLPHGYACLYRPHLASEAEQPLIMTLKQCVDRVFDTYGPDDEADEQGFDEIVHLEQSREQGQEFGCVWCPYRFLVHGKVHHTGSNMFSMIKKDGQWLISAVSDVARLT